jgi:hypothetical protein
MNRYVAAAVPALLALAACASTPPSPAAKSTTARDLPPATCASTPTGLVATPRDCAASGHTWTRNDISRTGAPTTAEALRLLDPTVTITGH